MGDSIRNIERIEEDDIARRMPRGVAVALVVLGGACVSFAAVAFEGRTAGPLERKGDPLGELLAQQARSGAPSVPSTLPATTDLSPKDVTFPRRLSDDEHPPTALAALRSVTPPSLPAVGSAPPAAAAQPPPATDRLPVMPLPAQAVLEATPIITHPRDAMTKAATEAGKIDSAPPSVDAAPPGHEGAYQLQVSSFHTQGEAQGFADQLRARGHKAYVVEATVPGRGTWYRVRIGPFGTQHAAAEYRGTFEDREHVVPFIVIPETTARAR